MDRKESLSTKDKKVRVFLGILDSKENNYRAGNFQKAHLRAYLKGRRLFKFGFHADGTPMYFQVSETLMDRDHYERSILFKGKNES